MANRGRGGARVRRSRETLKTIGPPSFVSGWIPSSFLSVWDQAPADQRAFQGENVLVCW